MTKAKNIRAAALGALAGLALASAWADAPRMLSYHGKLADVNGNPLNGSYDVTFEFYGAETGGSALSGYSYAAANVPVRNGTFHVEIGSTPAFGGEIPAEVFLGGTARYLQITVEGTALSPRERLVSSAYAISVASSSVGSYEIIDSTIQAVDLEATNSPTPGDLLSYDAGGGFTWSSNATGGGWTDTGSAVRPTNTGRTVTAAAGEGYVTFSTNVTVAQDLRVGTAAGFLGMGTSSPDFEVDVAGDMRIEGSGTLHFGGTGGASDVSLIHTGGTRVLSLGTGDIFNVNLGSFSLGGVTASQNVTAANLNTLTGGGNADSLHTHAAMVVSTLTVPYSVYLGTGATGGVAVGATNTSGYKLHVAGGARFDGNLDMNLTYLLQNIGDAGTDFTSGGGLTLAGSLNVQGSGVIYLNGSTILNADGSALTLQGTGPSMGVESAAKLNVTTHAAVTGWINAGSSVAAQAGFYGDGANVTGVQASSVTCAHCVEPWEIDGSGTAGDVFITDGGLNAAWATLGGDATMTAGGVLTLTDDAVEGSEIALGGDTDGDLMFYNGTNWARLAAGPVGYYLRTAGAGADPAWTWMDVSEVSDAMTLSTDQTASGIKTFTSSATFVSSITVGGMLHMAGAAGGFTSADRWISGNGAFGLKGTSSANGVIVTDYNSSSYLNVEVTANYATLGYSVGDGPLYISSAWNLGVSSSVPVAKLGVGGGIIAASSITAGSPGFYGDGTNMTSVNSSSLTCVDCVEPVEIDGGSASGQIFVTTATGWADWRAMSTDGSLAGNGAFTVPDNSIAGTQIALGSDARGDVMYYNGTDWARLPAGTAGQYLRMFASTPSWKSVTASEVSDVMTLTTNQTATGIKTFTSSVTVTDSRFSVGVTSLAVTGTGVGIGLSNPSDSLHVAGDIRVAGNDVVMAGTAAGYTVSDRWISGQPGYINLKPNDSNYGVMVYKYDDAPSATWMNLDGNDGYGTIGFMSDDGPLYLTNSDLVGIGTNTPTYGLHVIGSLVATSSVTAGAGFYGDGLNITGISASSSTCTGCVTAADVADDSLDFSELAALNYLDAETTISLGARTFAINMDGTGDFAIMDSGSGSHVFRDDGSVTFNESARDADFRVESANNANMLFVDAGMNRVGIGLSNPAYPLDVAGGIYASAGLYGPDLYSSGGLRLGGIFYDNENNNRYLNFGGLSVFNRVGVGTSNPQGPLLAASADSTQPYIFAATTSLSGGYALVVSTGGKVGVGVSNPLNALHSAVDVRVDGNDIIFAGTAGSYTASDRWISGANGYIDVKGTDFNAGLVIMDADDATGTNYLNIEANDSGFYGTIGYNSLSGPLYFTDTDSGRVGVGVAVPAAMFQVGGATLAVLRSGNVGIGVSVPIAPLEIQGPPTAEGVQQIIYNSQTAYNQSPSASIAIGGRYTSGGAYEVMGAIEAGKSNSVEGDGAGWMAIHTSSSTGNIVEALRLDSIGNLGIGTSAPVNDAGTDAGDMTTAGTAFFGTGSSYKVNNLGVTDFSTATIGNITASSTGNNYFAGRVGIGISNPAEDLDVVGHIVTTTPIVGMWSDSDGTSVTAAEYLAPDTEYENTAPGYLAANDDDIEVLVDGFYMLYVSVLKDSVAAGEESWLVLYKCPNSEAGCTNMGYLDSHGAGGSYLSLSGSVIRYMVAGEKFKVYDGNSTSGVYSGADWNKIIVYRMN